MGRRSAWVTAAAIAGMALALSACDSANDAAGPGDVTVSEAKALDEAAEMIEARKAPAPVASLAAPLPPHIPPPAPASDRPR